ncbi:apolipoprotein D-like [Chelonus insularis]|uniref:apolipoprotein D-like n=1 Tax=Chelonus insularis TaxID=460826 RepID=UPI00158844CF|nr:apolipoprotein D-like [Chelonus insularis]
MLKTIVLAACVLTIVRAQVPSLGWCPDYVPMANFDMAKFLGTWYEAERYFQLSEVVSRCVMANYSKGADNKLRVSNEVTNRFTGIKRVLEGEIKPPASKAEEGKLHVKYSLPLTPETSYAVLETDYKSYAVLWSCTGLGPVHTQNAWIMTRERRPPGEVLQKAYGVLDKYKISKTFFVKSDQEDCAYLDTPPSKFDEKPTPEPVPVEEPIVENVSEQKLRTAINPDTPEIILETRKAELAEAAAAAAVVAMTNDEEDEPKDEPAIQVVKNEPSNKEAPEDKKEEHQQQVPVSVAEIIIKTAEIPEKETSKPKEEEPSLVLADAPKIEKPAEVLKENKKQ